MIERRTDNSSFSYDGSEDTPFASASPIHPTAPPSYHDTSSYPMVVIPPEDTLTDENTPWSSNVDRNSYSSNLQFASENSSNAFLSDDNSNHNDNDNNHARHLQTIEQAQMLAQEDKNQRIVASGTAGAVLGWLLAGRFVGILAGFGSAYASTQPEGTASGDIGRALADVAIYIKQKALFIDQRHHIMDKAKHYALLGWDHAQEMDRQHHLVARFKTFVMWSITTTMALGRKHRLVERGAEFTSRGINYVSQRALSSCNDIGSTGGGGTEGTLQNRGCRSQRSAQQEGQPRFRVQTH